MQVIRTYSYRIKDSTSRKHLCKAAGSVNFVWNFINDLSYRSITERSHFLSAYDLQKYLTGSSKEIPELHSQTFQAIATKYVKARKQFKKIKLRWRSAKKRTLGWIPFKASGIQLDDDRVTYRGQTYRFWLSRPVPQNARLVTGSFNQDAQDRWYLNLQFRFEIEQPIPTGEDRLGMDLGLKTQVTCSDGTKFERECLTKDHETKLAVAQRANKKKQVCRIHAKIRNKRKDWNHKVSSELTRRCEVIRVGSVSSKGWMKTNLAKSVADAGWFQLKEILKNKAIMHGIDFEETNEAYSTVSCSQCLERTGPSGRGDLRVREWECSSCGTSHDRDVNAARNILSFGWAI